MPGIAAPTAAQRSHYEQIFGRLCPSGELSPQALSRLQSELIEVRASRIPLDLGPCQGSC